MTDHDALDAFLSPLVAPVGAVYGRLTVLEHAPLTRQGMGHASRRVACRCACGTPRLVVVEASLLSGNTQSCGCLHREHLAAGVRLIDETGHVFGTLVVLDRASRATTATTATAALWRCRCQVCGDERVVSGVTLRAGRARSCGTAACRARAR